MTWCAGRGGRRLELLDPRVKEVDFREIAWALAHVNRYGGHAETPISVGLHTLIVADHAPIGLRAYALLHDAHEARLGDTTAPVKETWAAAAKLLYGEKGLIVVEGVRRELERRHDAVIHAAAGLDLPGAREHAAIKLLDLRALATERRDFLGGHEMRSDWHIDAEGIEPFPRVYRFRAAPQVAEELMAAFRAWLPALRAPSRIPRLGELA